MQRLSMGVELLDGPLDDPATLRGNLRDLTRTNRWLGGVRLSGKAVDALLDGIDEASLLDVGTGAADIPVALIERARDSGRRLTITAVDSRPEIVEAARDVTPDLGSIPDLTLEIADGGSLRYEDDAFHVAHASLVMHHLEPDAAVAFLRELARVASRGVVVNDLVRSDLAWAGAWVLAHLFTMNRYTRHDAPLSVRRAYSPAEMAALLASADLRIEDEFIGLAGHRRAYSAVPA